ncbi:Transcriptional regulator [Gaiella occulta]|uniref:Transcriptional regulator n=2 Tax=Gaiella occulta TaxID=1002870 RepID=A0A7M2YUW3_9ACTN|nr:Transcriptional regulator [Gaiella occulta]
MASSAADALRDLIVMGEIAPGTPLRLEVLAERLGMSISPIREAVRQLEALGLAEHVPYKGARVTQIDPGEMRDVYEARLALELIAVRRAAIGWNEDAETLLCAALDDLSSAYQLGERVEIIRGNTAFHLAIAQASGSRWIPRLLRPMLETSERFSAFVIADDQAGVYDIEEQGHTAIVSACRAGDAEMAERMLREHIDAFADIFVRDLVAEPTG